MPRQLTEEQKRFRKTAVKQEKIKKTVIFTGYQCNNHCIFCIHKNRRHLPQKSTAQIIGEMREARRRGRTYLELVGGEETIRSDFFLLIQQAQRLGFPQIAIPTNGRLFSYRNFAEKAIGAGITEIIFSIHGYKASLHDSLTRAKGSFRQLIKGIANIGALGFENISSNTTIVMQNYAALPKIGRFISGLGIKNAEFIFVDPTYGGAHDAFNVLVPKISIAAPFIKKCLDLGRKNGALHWHVRYVPLCRFLGYESNISELHEMRHFQTEHIAPDFYNPHVERSRKECGRLKTKKCRGCGYFDICEGIWKAYISHYGDNELQPIAQLPSYA